MNNQLVNLSFLDREVATFKHARENIEKIEDDINNIIESNTKKEKQELDTAINNYNNKVKNLLESSSVKEKTNKLEEYSDMMSNSISKAFETYKKALVLIDQKIDDSEKRIEYKKLLHKRVIERFLNDEEIHMFNNLVNMMGNGNVVIMGGNRMLCD